MSLRPGARACEPQLQCFGHHLDERIDRLERDERARRRRLTVSILWGTEGSNPCPSSGESANYRFLTGGAVSRTSV
jgi:hypothetical protein